MTRPERPPRRIVVCSPHARHDAAVTMLRDRGHDVTRVHGPDELRADALREIAPDVCFFPHWSWIIPAEVFEEHECVIFHMTDVPYGRGGSPLQNLIQAGHEETVMAALRCTAEVDAGPVYLKRPMSLEGPAHAIYDRAAGLIAQMMVEILDQAPEPVAQRGPVVTFSRRTPEQSRISGDEAPSELYDHIRMLDAPGYPRAFVDVGQLRLSFTEAELEEGHVTARVQIIRREP